MFCTNLRSSLGTTSHAWRPMTRRSPSCSVRMRMRMRHAHCFRVAISNPTTGTALPEDPISARCKFLGLRLPRKSTEPFCLRLSVIKSCCRSDKIGAASHPTTCTLNVGILQGKLPHQLVSIRSSKKALGWKITDWGSNPYKHMPVFASQRNV